MNSEKRKVAIKSLAMAYLRLGERINCIKDHSGSRACFPFPEEEYMQIKQIRKKQLNYTRLF